MSHDRDTGTRSPGRGSLQSAFFALFILCLVAFWIWSEGAERRAIRNLPPAERSAVYQRSLDNFRAVCGHADLALEEYCRDQAETLLAFPECDDACRKLASGQIGR